MALYKRTLPSGKEVWYISYRNLDGGWKRESTGVSNNKVAEQIYRKKLEDIALRKRGLIEEEERAKAPSLEKFREEYLDYLKANRRAANTLELNKYAFNNLLKILGNKNIRDVSQRDIEKWKLKCLELLVDTSVNIYQRSLDTAFSVAVRWGYLKKNPFGDVEVVEPESDMEKPKVYSQEQLQRLFGAMDRNNLFWARLFKLYLCSGMRRNELIYLEWEDIDFHKREVRIRNKPHRKFFTKTRYERTIPLTRDMESILKDIGVKESGLIFEGQRSKGVLNEDFVCRKFKKYATKAGIESHLTIHNLRHTFATRRLEKGASLIAISKLLGHTTTRTTQKYEHTEARQFTKEAELDSLEDVLGREEPE